MLLLALRAPIVSFIQFLILGCRRASQQWHSAGRFWFLAPHASGEELGIDMGNAERHVFGNLVVDDDCGVIDTRC
jgi:hypothetical protein